MRVSIVCSIYHIPRSQKRPRGFVFSYAPLPLWGALSCHPKQAAQFASIGIIDHHDRRFYWPKMLEVGAVQRNFFDQQCEWRCAITRMQTFGQPTRVCKKGCCGHQRMYAVLPLCKGCATWDLGLFALSTEHWISRFMFNCGMFPEDSKPVTSALKSLRQVVEGLLTKTRFENKYHMDICKTKGRRNQIKQKWRAIARFFFSRNPRRRRGQAKNEWAASYEVLQSIAQIIRLFSQDSA